MDTFFRPTWAEISLDALRHNYLAFRKAIPQAIKIMAVVKANGYGHGAVQIAREAIKVGADYLGVAFLDEALELRKAGITAPVLVLGYTPPEGFALARAHRIAITVYSTESLARLTQAVPGDAGIEITDSMDGVDSSLLKIHIKLDTGMGRLGLRVAHDVAGAVRFIEEVLALRGVEVEGLFTHYASADDADASYTYEQYDRFSSVVNYFAMKDVVFPIVHAGNSATALQFPQLAYNMVRLGISLYGMYPSDEVDRQQVVLQPVMSLKTSVVMAKSLPPYSKVSYGGIYQTAGEEQIATLPVGYGDGYSRMLTGQAEVLIQGQRAPVVGRICMDQCMVNVTSIPDVKVGTEVVLFGRQGNETILTDDLARVLGTINYEVTCMVSRRVPRVYIRDGQVVDVVNELG